MPRDGILLLDSLVGLWLDRLYPAPGPVTVRFPFGTGTLGFGGPAAVGAKLARPERGGGGGGGRGGGRRGRRRVPLQPPGTGDDAPLPPEADRHRRQR